jgi:hypothetical protein
VTPLGTTLRTWGSLGQVLSKGPLFGHESRLLRVGSYVKKEFVFGIILEGFSHSGPFPYEERGVGSWQRMGSG